MIMAMTQEKECLEFIEKFFKEKSKEIILKLFVKITEQAKEKVWIAPTLWRNDDSDIWHLSWGGGIGDIKNPDYTSLEIYPDDETNNLFYFSRDRDADKNFAEECNLETLSSNFFERVLNCKPYAREKEKNEDANAA